jgi:hypothetical protein
MYSRPMRFLAAILLLACSGPRQEVPASRDSISSDWCRVEFAPDLRTRALEFMTAAGPARARVGDRLGLPVGSPLTILVVRDVDETRAEVVARTGREPPDWAGGLALPEHDLVIVRADLGGEPFDRVDSILTHELVHIAVARARKQEEAAAIPRWFEEGLAQWVAGRARPLDVPDLRPAATFGYLLDLSEMNAAFAHGEGAAARAYAQAESFVRFIARRRGADGVRHVMERLLDGVDLDIALSAVTAANLAMSWSAWQAELRADRGWIVGTASQALIAILILVVVALGVRRVMRRKKTIEESWGDEPDDAG